MAELPGGLTNTNYKVDVAGRSYVVRVSGKDTGLLAIDREHEHHNSVAAAEAGVGAAVVDYLPERSMLVLEFIEGATQSAEDLRRGDRLDWVADACRRLHGGRRFLGDFDMFEIQARYRRLVGERGFRLPERYDEFAPQVAAIREALAVRDEGTVPCNNDLLAENFIDVGDRFRLIDYEYAGNNDACFELGNIWSESNLSLAQLERARDALLRRAAAAQDRARPPAGLMSKYGWTLWASIQDGVSEIDFDFWSWGMEKYERAVAEFDGPDFARLLEEARRGRTSAGARASSRRRRASGTTPRRRGRPAHRRRSGAPRPRPRARAGRRGDRTASPRSGCPPRSACSTSGCEPAERRLLHPPESSSPPGSATWARSALSRAPAVEHAPLDRIHVAEREREPAARPGRAITVAHGGTRDASSPKQVEARAAWTTGGRSSQHAAPSSRARRSRSRAAVEDGRRRRRPVREGRTCSVGSTTACHPASATDGPA